MHEVRDKPIVSYVGDSVVIVCKMEETKPKPSTWNWYKANGTDKVGKIIRAFLCVVLSEIYVAEIVKANTWWKIQYIYSVNTFMTSLDWYLFQEQIFTAAEPLRYEIKNDERKTKLVVYNLTEADGGLYYCGAVYAINTTMGLVELKVRCGKYIYSNTVPKYNYEYL